MSALQQRQFPIDRAIFGEVLACLPSSWRRVKLVAAVKQTSSSGVVMDVRLDGFGQPGIASVSEVLMGKIRELFLLNNQFHTNLRGISYTYTLEPDGKWAWSADYTYA
ncbi:MAG: hypothetical protein L6Q76_04630 [Polyangiaceae bacterium]|nr:hypothetical protein [Polyangiaceae bacterium]